MSFPPAPISCIYLNQAEYYGEDFMLGKYLETLEQPPDIDDDEFKKIQTKAQHFFLRNELLYK